MLAIGVNAQSTTSTQSKDDEGVHFLHGTYEEALAEAKRQGKMLFVDVWATWCGPCVRLGKEIFPQKAVGDFFNANFVCYKLQTDPSDPAAKAHAAELEKKWKVQAIPALFWIDNDGKVAYSTLGYMSTERLIAEAKKALDPTNNLTKIQAKWDGGDHSLTSGLAYFTKISKDQDKLLKWYKTLTPQQQVSTELQALIQSNSSWHTGTYTYIASKWPQYAKAANAEQWQKQMQMYIEQTAVKEMKTEEKFKAWATEWKQYGLDFHDKAFEAAFIMHKVYNGEAETGKNLLTAYVKRHGIDNTVYRFVIYLTSMKGRYETLADFRMPKLNDWTEELARSGKTDQESMDEAYLYRAVAYGINDSKDKMQKLIEEAKTANISADIKEYIEATFADMK